MSHRRSTTGGKMSPPNTTMSTMTTKTTTEIVTMGSLSLEQEEIVPLSTSSPSLSTKTANTTTTKAMTTTSTSSTTTTLSSSSTASSSCAGGEVVSSENGSSSSKASQIKLQILQWKESPFAASFTESTWEPERSRSLATFGSGPSNNNRSRKSRIKSRRRGINRDLEENDVVNNNNSHNDDEEEEVERLANDLSVPDTTGCLCCSALICPFLGAQRIGNMVVLSSTMEWVEEVEEDASTGECQMRRFKRPKLRLVMGPYWPMLLFVTYPLILAVSGWAFYAALWPLNRKPWMVNVVWLILTTSLIVALALTGCRDPGILYRYTAPPPQFENNWRWSDQAQSYRPRNAYFDTDTGVVVEEFDHTCPWTGTAIGKRNMLSFQFFVCLVFVCLIMDIFLITGAF